MNEIYYYYAKRLQQLCKKTKCSECQFRREGAIEVEHFYTVNEPKTWEVPNDSAE